MRSFPLHTPEQLTAVLRDLRQQHGLTQAQAASALGITQQSYSAYGNPCRPDVCPSITPSVNHSQRDNHGNQQVWI